MNFVLALFMSGVCILCAALILRLKQAMKALNHYQHGPVRIIDLEPGSDDGTAHLRVIVQDIDVYSRDIRVDLTSAQYLAGAPFFREVCERVIECLREYQKQTTEDH